MIQNIALGLFFLISLVVLDGCATFTDQYSVGTKTCKELCLKDAGSCKVSTGDNSFTCGE